MGDVILYWNGIALEANRISHSNGKEEQTGPTLSSRALAIVHLAMYDAYVGAAVASGKPSPGAHYLGVGLPPAPPPNTSIDTAVAGAAYETLTRLFPSQTLFFDLVYDEAYIPDGIDQTAAENGYAYGRQVGAAMYNRRMGDIGAVSLTYKPSLERGKHRRDPDNPAQGFHGPDYGMNPLFAATTPHTLDDPPDVDTGAGEYRNALREVLGKGIAPELMGTINPVRRQRTEEETVIGLYWGYDGANGLGTPPRLYNQIIRKVAMHEENPDNMPAAKNTPAQNARLFALVNAAMADAGILAWAEKYRFNYWRPIVGIREHDESFGPMAPAPANEVSDDCDSGWLPLGAPSTNSTMKNFTPPFPAYPSGHATFGAAAFQMTRRFYKVTANGPDPLFDDLDFVSDELDGNNRDNKGAVRPRHVRNFPDGLWQMIIENGRSRVYLGVHWVFDAFAVNDDDSPDLTRTVGGVPLGLAIANDIFDTGMLVAANAHNAAMLETMAEAEAVAPVVPINTEVPRLPWPLG